MAAHNLNFHAATWWLWAMCAAISISLQENLVIVGLIICLAIWVSKNLISELKNWRTFLVMVRLAILITVTRIFLQIALGVPVGNNVILRLPQIQLPEWISGLRIGGIVTQESLLASLNDSVRLSGLIVIIATAVALTTTSRFIGQLPVAFHEVGMVIIIAFTFLPHLFEDVQRIKQASRWRGQESGKIKTISQNLVSICESALERSVRLAAALTVRGYASATSNQKWRKPIYLGLMFFTLGILRLLVTKPTFIDFGIFAISTVLILSGIRMAEKIATRSKFRTENWSRNDYFVLSISAALLITSFFKVPNIQLICVLLILIFAMFIKKMPARKLVTS